MKWITALLLLVAIPAFAQEPFMVQVQKTYSVDTARQEAFENLKPWVDLSGVQSIDPNLIENRRSVQAGGGEAGDRSITVFNSGFYTVSAICDLAGYTYTAAGQLFSVDYTSSPAYHSAGMCEATFPAKSYKHLYPSGQLARVSLYVSDHEAFMFLPDGTLDAHWVKNKCFNANGSSCGTRRSFTSKN